MYTVTYIYREPFCDSENIITKSFLTIEEVSKYIRDGWYESYCDKNNYPDEWDEIDMCCLFPSKNDFSIDAIKNKLQNNKNALLFGPRSDNFWLVLDELWLKID